MADHRGTQRSKNQEKAEKSSEIIQTLFQWGISAELGNKS